jgi:hypothetical protein
MIDDHGCLLASYGEEDSVAELLLFRLKSVFS